MELRVTYTNRHYRAFACWANIHSGIIQARQPETAGMKFTLPFTQDRSKRTCYLSGCEPYGPACYTHFRQCFGQPTPIGTENRNVKVDGCPQISWTNMHAIHYYVAMCRFLSNKYKNRAWTNGNRVRAHPNHSCRVICESISPLLGRKVCLNTIIDCVLVQPKISASTAGIDQRNGGLSDGK